jgi:hypothetical protein
VNDLMQDGHLVHAVFGEVERVWLWIVFFAVTWKKCVTCAWC